MDYNHYIWITLHMIYLWIIFFTYRLHTYYIFYTHINYIFNTLFTYATTLMHPAALQGTTKQLKPTPHCDHKGAGPIHIITYELHILHIDYIHIRSGHLREHILY